MGESGLMVIPECILRWTVGSALYKALEPLRVTEEQMPWAYQVANPTGRPLHNDWALFKDTTRRSCARRAPLPYRGLSGVFTKEWMLFDENYPLSPGMETRYLNDGEFQVLTDRAGYGLGTFEAFIDGAWRPVFHKYTRAFDIPFLGRYRLSWYYGLHQDNHVSLIPDESGIRRSDLMCWIEPFAASFVKEI